MQERAELYKTPQQSPQVLNSKSLFTEHSSLLG